MNIKCNLNFFLLPFIFCALKHSVAKMIAPQYLMQPNTFLKKWVKRVKLSMLSTRTIEIEIWYCYLTCQKHHFDSFCWCTFIRTCQILKSNILSTLDWNLRPVLNLLINFMLFSHDRKHKRYGMSILFIIIYLH